MSIKIVNKIINKFNFVFQEEKSRTTVGDIFQDEDNMAAILMRKHLETGDLIMVSKLIIYLLYYCII